MQVISAAHLIMFMLHYARFTKGILWMFNFTVFLSCVECWWLCCERKQQINLLAYYFWQSGGRYNNNNKQIFQNAQLTD